MEFVLIFNKNKTNIYNKNNIRMSIVQRLASPTLKLEFHILNS